MVAFISSSRHSSPFLLRGRLSAELIGLRPPGPRDDKGVGSTGILLQPYCTAAPGQPSSLPLPPNNIICAPHPSRQEPKRSAILASKPSWSGQSPRHWSAASSQPLAARIQTAVEPDERADGHMVSGSPKPEGPF